MSPFARATVRDRDDRQPGGTDSPVEALPVLHGPLDEPPERLLETVRELVRSHTGIEFGATRRHTLLRALESRRSTAGAKGWDAYIRLLTSSHSERQELFQLLVNNETSFFRHPPSFAALGQHVLPELVAERSGRGTRQLLAWSAGCSTGQEACSIAIEVAESVDLSQWKFAVYGTDLSATAIHHARTGSFRLGVSDTLSAERLRRHFRPIQTGGGMRHEPSPDLRSKLHFQVSNLLDDALCSGPQFDVVFCQNVLIYFGIRQRTAVVEMLAKRLAPGGYLFLAPGEFVGLRVARLEPVRFDDALVFRKSAREEAR